MQRDITEVYPEDQNKTSDIERDFTKVHTKYEPQFGQVEVLENPKDGHQIYMKQEDFESVEAFDHRLMYVKKRRVVQSHTLNGYLDFTSNLQSKGFSKKIWVRHFFEIPKKYLSVLIEMNHPSISCSIFLTELLYQITKAGAQLQEKGIAHGSISDEFISIKEPHNFKLIDNFSSLGSFDHAVQRIVRGEVKYTSPEVFQKVKSKEPLDRINMSKHDVFCFGLLMLRIALGPKVQDIYNKRDGTFNFSLFTSYKNEFQYIFREKQNTLLAFTVTENMLEYDHTTRLDFISLLKKIPKHSQIKAFFGENYKLKVNASFYDRKFKLT